ncbi:uncharacterized protein LOC143445090 isoform X2 [Clavelina lepadiformis]
MKKQRCMLHALTSRKMGMSRSKGKNRASSSKASSPLSAVSSRSSSASRSTPTFRKDEEIITDVAGTLVNEFKKQMIADIEEKIKKSFSEISQPPKKYNGNLNEVIQTTYEKETNKLTQAAKQESEKAMSKHINKNTFSKAKADISVEVKKTINENFAGEWQDTAMGHLDNATEDLENNLWREMSDTLGKVFRLYRNTGNTLTIQKQTNIALMGDRLESQLTQLEFNNEERICYLTSTTQDYLTSKLEEKENELKLKLELNVKTINREIAQLKAFAKQQRQLHSERQQTKSSL